MRTVAPLLLAAALAAAAPAAADTFEATPADDLEQKIATLRPGDELIVHGGTYTLSGRFTVSLVGTAAAPIVIRAADGERPVIDRPNADQNIWDLDRADHVTLRGLEFRGGSAGLRITAADHLTIEGCEIHDTADVALRANDGGATYRNLVIRGNHIHDTSGTGEGMYLGCNDDGCRVLDSIIERNWVHATNGPGVSQGDGIELKEGSAGNVIRDNVIHDTNYPCILTYSASGNGDANVIERNLMWGCGDHAIQSAADATIRNNIILGSVANGIAMQPHQAGTPSNLTVVHNTVLHADHDAVRASGITGRVVIANNALYAQAGNAIAVAGDLGQVIVAGNRGVGALAGVTTGFTVGALATDVESGSYAGAPPMDLFPRAGSSLLAGGDVAYAATDDYNGRARNGVADVGAYAFAPGGNPGPPIGPGIKPPTGSSSDGDGGVDGGDVSMTQPGGCCQTGGAPTSGLGLGAIALALLVRRRRR